MNLVSNKIILRFKQGKSILKFLTAGKLSGKNTIVDSDGKTYRRYPLSSWFSWFKPDKWYDDDGKEITEEITLKNGYILKPNGTYSHVTARRAAQQSKDKNPAVLAVNKNVSQLVIDNSVKKLGISSGLKSYLEQQGININPETLDPYLLSQLISVLSENPKQQIVVQETPQTNVPIEQEGDLNKINEYSKNLISSTLKSMSIPQLPINGYTKYLIDKFGMKFKKGGNIKKFQNPSSPLFINWSKLTPAGQELVDRAISQTRAITRPVEERVQKASKINKNVAAKLLEMWNMGAFKGVIDRKTGKEVTFERAVDGIMGRMTREAEANRDKIWRNGLNFTSFSSLKKSSVLKTNNKSNLSNLYSVTHFASTGGFSSFVHAPYKDSQNTGLQAIFDHKRNLNVGSNYAVIDKTNKTLNIYNKDKLLESHPITIGSEIGDGMVDLKSKYLSETPRTTGAGVFTIETYPTSDYLGNEPMLELHPDFVSKVVLAIHSPASMNRLRALKDPKGSKRVSYGCVSPDCGVVKRIYDNKILQDNDTVYVLPEISGNELIENNGKLRMRWNGNNPETYDNGKKRFTYNNKR